MFSFGSKSRAYLNELLGRRPAARAQIRGDANHPSLSGDVSFYPVNGGVLVLADVHGLPTTGANGPGRFFGFHIHEGGACTGTDQDPFADAKGHFNPQNAPIRSTQAIYRPFMRAGAMRGAHFSPTVSPWTTSSAVPS